MKRLIVICEGETEQEFCKDVLLPHLLGFEISIETPLIKKSMGGIVAWKYLKSQIMLHLKEDVYVSMLIDYYGINSHHHFPMWDESKLIANRIEKMSFLENAMLEDIEERFRYRFIPYIQLHEFEGLLFNNIESFKDIISAKEFTNIQELEETINAFENPELINDGPNTSPSKRLVRLIIGYNKIVYGAILAQEIGLKKIRTKAVRFNEWLSKIEKLKWD